MVKILLVVVLIGILIIIHEFGHYLMAKILKVDVAVFSIGFGPSILEKKISGTLFKLSIIPLGGYVKLCEDDKDPIEYLQEKPSVYKFLISFAGPFSNILFGFILLFFTYSIVGITDLPNAPIYKISGFKKVKKGDVIIEIDGIKVRTWSDINKLLSSSKFHKIKVCRGKDTFSFYDTLSQDWSIYPCFTPVIGKVLKGSPAEKAGIKRFDIIVGIENKPIKCWFEAVDIIKKSPERPLAFKILRGKDTIKLKVIPQKVEIDGKNLGQIGVYLLLPNYKYSFFKSLEISFNKAINGLFLIARSLKNVILQKRFKEIGGPVMIGKVMVESMSWGLDKFLILFAFISLNLAFINLLPLPALDGSYIIYSIIEILFRRKISPKVLRYIQLIGLIVLFTLGLFLIFWDIFRVFFK